VNVILIVAGAEVLVEEGSIAAVVGVLLPVGVAEVVDLRRTARSDITTCDDWRHVPSKRCQ
jgi:hypothetical protein